MTLRIEGDKIYIENADGTEKFSSDNKLLRPVYEQTGSGSLGYANYDMDFYNANGGIPTCLPLPPLEDSLITYEHTIDYAFNPDTDVALIFAKITGGTGNQISYLSGKELRMSGPICFDATHDWSTNVYDEVKINYSILSAMFMLTPSYPTLQFTAMSMVNGAGLPLWPGGASHASFHATVAFDWRVKILTHR